MIFGDAPRRLKVVIISLDVLALLALAGSIPLVQELFETPGALKSIGRYLAYRAVLVAWVVVTHYGLVRRERWGRESGIWLLVLMLFSSLAGIMLSSLPLPEELRTRTTWQHPLVYVIMSVVIAIPLSLLVSAKSAFGRSSTPASQPDVVVQKEIPPGGAGAESDDRR